MVNPASTRRCARTWASYALGRLDEYELQKGQSHVDKCSNEPDDFLAVAVLLRRVTHRPG